MSFKCTVCGIELKAKQRSEAITSGDCWPVCSVCASKRAGTSASRETLMRILYAAGRKISCCQACGTSGKLEIHFLKPIAGGGTPVSSNLLLLCPDCHDKVHAGARIRGRIVQIHQADIKGEEDCIEKKQHK